MSEKIIHVVNQPDFRKYLPQYDSKRNVYLCVCEELIGGRWEGFISLYDSFEEAPGGKSEKQHRGD